MKVFRLAFLAALAGPCAAAASPAGDIAGTWECRLPGIEYRNKPPILYVADTGESQVTIEVDGFAREIYGRSEIAADQGGWWKVKPAQGQEFMIRPDADGRAVVLANEPAAVTLLDGTIPVDVRAGDKLSGVYLFDHLTASNGARVQSRDAITVSNAPTIDATSKLVVPNAGAPSIDAAKVSIVAGANGVSLVGAAGAVSDPDTPLHAVARDIGRGALPPRTFALQNASNVGVGGNGGFSLSKPFGSNAFGDSGVSSTDTIAQGYVSFSAVTDNRVAVPAGLSPTISQPIAVAFSWSICCVGLRWPSLVRLVNTAPASSFPAISAARRFLLI